MDLEKSIKSGIFEKKSLKKLIRDFVSRNIGQIVKESLEDLMVIEDLELVQRNVIKNVIENEKKDTI